MEEFFVGVVWSLIHVDFRYHYWADVVVASACVVAEDNFVVVLGAIFVDVLCEIWRGWRNKVDHGQMAKGCGYMHAAMKDVVNLDRGIPKSACCV